MIRLKTKKKEVLALVIMALLIAILVAVGVLANVFDSATVATDVIENNVSATDFNEVSSLNTANLGKMKVSGYTKWTDGTNTYPAIKLLVKVYAKKLTGTEYIDQTYTDTSGKYTLSYTYNNILCQGYFVRVYAQNENYYKVGSYYWESDVYKGDSDRKVNIPERTFYMSEDIGRAVQVAQALYVARSFAGSFAALNAIGRVDVGFSGSSLEYTYATNGDSSTSRIKGFNLPAAAYASWDRIIQAYGAVIASYRGFYYAAFDGYPNNINLKDQPNTTGLLCNGYHSNILLREQSTKIAWGDAWTIVFSIAAQEEFTSTVFDGIATFKDKIYEPFDNLSFNVETTDVCLGEACTQSVCAVLWDIIDTDNDGSDYVSGFFIYWLDQYQDVAEKDLFTFIQNFYDHNPQKIDILSANLVKYKMAVSYNITGTDTIITDAENMTPIVFTDIVPTFPDDYGCIVIFSEDYTKRYYVNYLVTHNSAGELSSLRIGSSFALEELAQQYFNTHYFRVDNTAFSGDNEWISNFEEINSWDGEYVRVTLGCSSNDQETGYFASSTLVKKKVFRCDESGTSITGTYCNIGPTVNIPAEIDGQTITSIGESAFQNKQNFAIVVFPADGQITEIGDYAFEGCQLGITALPASVRTIGSYAFANIPSEGAWYISFNEGIETIADGAFSGTNLSNLKSLPMSLKSIEHNAFRNSQLHADFCLPCLGNLQYIGERAFQNCQMKAVNIHYHLRSGYDYDPAICSNAFYGCSNLTIYTDATERPGTWGEYWHSNRPVVWSVSFTDNYVSSFTKSYSSFSNVTSSGISNPVRDGYDFNGWYTETNGNGTKYTSANITSVPDDTTLYAYWTKQSSCVAEGTLITLADGSQVAVEDLTGEEYLLVWNMLTGEYDAAPMIFIDSDPCTTYEIIELTFSDNTQVKVIDEHAFFDMTLGEYVFLRNDAAQYIGHYFNKQGANGAWESVQLVSVNIYNEVTTAWSPVTFGHLCFYVNGMLSMPGATEGLINIFDVDTALMTFDEDQMAEDIATYGLFTYEEFSSIIPLPELVFEAFGGQYLKVSIGKGLITFDEIIERLNRYADFFE